MSGHDEKDGVRPNPSNELLRDRQMSVISAALDHVGINARDDLEAAAVIYRRLGFNLTDRGQTGLGSMNHRLVLATDYIELIGLPRDRMPARRIFMDYPCGLNGLVFATDDAASTFDALSKSGLPFDPPVEFSRSNTRTKEESRHIVTFMKPFTTSYGRVYFCQHLDRSLVWEQERRHPNGAVATKTVWIVDQDPSRCSEMYATIFGEDAVRDRDGGKTVIAGNAEVNIVTDPAFRELFQLAAADALDRPSYMAGLTVRTTSLEQAFKVLTDNGLSLPPVQNGRLVVPAQYALNTTLEFVE